MRPVAVNDGKARPAVTVRLAAKSERPLLDGLFQFYAYDFSELEPSDSPRLEINAEGRFDPYPHFDEYWSAGGRWPLLVQSGDRTVGFALINTVSHRGGAVERSMAEFFVVRKHRLFGIATEALHHILAMYPGRWEIAVATRNETAKAFWAKAIASATNVADRELVDGDGTHWTGVIWCFRALPPV